MTTPSPAVSIITVTFRSRDHIGACLDTIAAHTEAPTEIIVVDNDSDDGTADYVEAHHPEARLIRSGGNLGFAKGVNLGADVATAPYLLLLNPDTTIEPGAIDTVLALAAARPSARIYGGVTVDHEGRPDDLGSWGLPSLWGMLCLAVGATTAFKRNRLLNPTWRPAPTGTEPVEVPAVSGAFQLIDRKLFEDLDGLDPRFFMYGEDVDWAMRARAAGARPLVDPTARLHHEVGASSTSENKRVMVCRGMTTVISTHWSTPRRQLGIWLLNAGVWLRGSFLARVLRLVGRTPEESWAAAWERREEWRAGW